jgi:hypothetical protein
LAKDIRSGHTSPEQAATLLDQIADMSELSLEQWLAAKEMKPVLQQSTESALESKRSAV